MLQKPTIKKVICSDKESLLDKFKEIYPEIYTEEPDIVIKICELFSNCSESELSTYTTKKLDSIRSHSYMLQTIAEEYKSLNVTKVLNDRLKQSNSSSGLLSSAFGYNNNTNLELDELEARSVLNRTQFYYNRTQELHTKCLAKNRQITLFINFLNIIPTTNFIKSEIELLDNGYLQNKLLISQIEQTLNVLKTTLESTGNFISVNLPLISKARGLKSDIVNINGSLATSFFDDENISVLENLNKIIKSRVQEFREYDYFQQIQNIFNLCNKKTGFIRSLLGKDNNNNSLALKNTIELEKKIDYFYNDLNRLCSNAIQRKDKVDDFFLNLNDEHYGKDALTGLINKSEQLITELHLILEDINSVKDEISILKQTIVKNQRA